MATGVHANIPPRKRLAFAAAMLALPVLFFALMEGALRLSGFGESYPLFVPVDHKPEILYQNREVARRYFTHIKNIPTSLTDFFEAEKDTSTFRIFVQGESSAAGFPFYYGGAFSRMLEQRLMQTFPERHIEVVNTSMAATNSYTLLDIADEILEHDPDAVLMYVGHNEYYGALGVGSSESIGKFPWMIRTYLALKDWRIVQALRKLMAWTMQRLQGVGTAPSATLMQRMVGNEAIPYESGDYRLGLRQFQSNLSRLLKKYRDRGIPVFIGTVASNERDHEPVVSGFAKGTDKVVWQTSYERGLDLAERGETAAALNSLESAISLDSLNADAYFAKGRILEDAGRYPAARASYVAAKDRDELRFRAPEAMNGIVREEAARYGAHVVDTQGALSAGSPNGIIGSSVMTEHLHPNVQGYFLIADAFYNALRSEGLIGQWSRVVPAEAARAEILLTAVDSLVGEFRVRQLKSVWPFQPPGVVKSWQDSVRADDPVVQIALDLYNDKVSWRAANEALRQFLESRGDYHGALQAALAQIQEYPFIPEPYLSAGNNLIKQRRYEEALAYFEAANEVGETASAHRMIGSLLLQRGDRGRALPHLERAVAMSPTDPAALYNLAGLYALNGEYERARSTVGRLLQVAPGHPEGRRLLGSLPEGS